MMSEAGDALGALSGKLGKDKDGGSKPLKAHSDIFQAQQNVLSSGGTAAAGGTAANPS